VNDQLKKDFPVDWEDDHFVTRREFFKFMTLASGVMAAGTAALAVSAQIPRGHRAFEPAFICRSVDLAPGSSLAFSYPRPSDLCLLVRRQSGDLAGFTRRCTHLSCPVEYENKEGVERLYCPCHHGAFSIETGAVTQGPPPHPLPMVTVELRGDEIWAVGVEVGRHA
jgi:nitrite reductase/ring-hydroxylating ferredoxin subunit